MDEQYKFDFICSLMHELSDFNSLAIYHALDASRFIFFCKTRIVKRYSILLWNLNKPWSKVLVKFLSNCGQSFFYSGARNSMDNIHDNFVDNFGDNYRDNIRDNFSLCDGTKRLFTLVLFEKSINLAHTLKVFVKMLFLRFHLTR